MTKRTPSPITKTTTPLPSRLRHDQPTVLFHNAHIILDALEGLLVQTREFGWRPIDMRATDGIIPHGCNPIGAIIGLPADQETVRWIKDLDCPIVRVGFLPHPLDHQFPAVIHDLSAVGSLAAEHFAHRNFRYVAYIGHQPWGMAQTAFERFRQHAESLGMTCHLLRLTGNERGDDRFVYHKHRDAKIEQWLTDLPKPVGLLTPAAAFGAQLCMNCATVGLEIPEQVAILSGTNRLPFCQTAPIPLSAIDQDDKGLGREAVRLLHRIIRGESPPPAAIIIPPAGIVERQSTDVLAVQDPVVARALRYIWDHLEAKTTVDDIAAEVGTTRRTLERAFRNTLGRTVHAERNRKRLEYCAEFLRTTDQNIETIANAAGFPSTSSMYRAFEKRYHMSPGDFRKHRRT